MLRRPRRRRAGRPVPTGAPRTPARWPAAGRRPGSRSACLAGRAEDQHGHRSRAPTNDMPANQRIAAMTGRIRRHPAGRGRPRRGTARPHRSRRSRGRSRAAAPRVDARSSSARPAPAPIPCRGRSGGRRAASRSPARLWSSVIPLKPSGTGSIAGRLVGQEVHVGLDELARRSCRGPGSAAGPTGCRSGS